MIRISTESELKRLVSKLTKSELERANRMAMRDAARWAKTRMGESVEKRYNIKKTKVNAKLSLRTAGTDAIISASHQPVNIASLASTRMESKAGRLKALGAVLKSRTQNTKSRTAKNKLFVSVEVVKGKRKRIESAFLLGTTKGKAGAAAIGDRATIFARGKYESNGFKFDKSRKPIAAIKSVSVATAVLHQDVQKVWSEQAKKKASEELERQVKRMIS